MRSESRAAIYALIELLDRAPKLSAGDVRLDMHDRTRRAVVESLKDAVAPPPAMQLTGLESLAIANMDPATLAVRYYNLVGKNLAAQHRIVPWENLPMPHRQVFIDAAAALLRGDE